VLSALLCFEEVGSSILRHDPLQADVMITAGLTGVGPGSVDSNRSLWGPQPKQH